MTDETLAAPASPNGPGKGGRKVRPGEAGGAGSGRKVEQDRLKRDGNEGSGESSLVTAVPFDFEGTRVRTIAKGSDIWFAAADACSVLEIGNVTDVVNRLDDDEKGVDTIETLGGPQRLNTVSESGLYSLIFTSRKPEARAFRRWVTGVVLPTLRRRGQFDMSGEPGQSTIAQHQSGNGEAMIALPGPGRYLVGLSRDGEQRIEPIFFSDAISAVAALDCRSIAYSHLTAASLWEKLQHLRSSGVNINVGYTQEKLNATMQAGAELARQILYSYDEPLLIRRPPAKTVAD